MKENSMKCPVCNTSIAPYKVFTITRWSPIKCAECDTLVTRKIDIQFWAVYLLLITPLIILKIDIFSPIFIAWLVVIMLIDAYTVKLISIKS